MDKKRPLRVHGFPDARVAKRARLAIGHPGGDSTPAPSGADLAPPVPDGDPAEQYKLGCALATGRTYADRQSAARLFGAAARSGHACAQYRLALMHRHGEGVVRDSVEAARLLEMAAGNGHAEACVRLADMLRDGDEVPRDGAKALRFYKSAADMGDVYAQRMLASLYRTGDGVSAADAAHYLRLAADQGDAVAQFELAQMYYDGETAQGLPLDDQEALALLKLSALQSTTAMNLLAALYAHGERGAPQDVLCLAFSPAAGGRTLVSCGADRTLRVWDTLTWQPLSNIPTGHAGEVTCCCFAPDGCTVVTGSHDHTLRIWSLREPAQTALVSVLLGHTGPVTCCAFDPDGQRILSGSRDGTLRLWSVKDNSHVVITGHSNWVSCCTFSLDGERILSGSLDRSLRLWNAKDLSLIASWEHHNGIYCCAFSPDGSVVLSGCSDRNLKMFSVANSAVVSSVTCSERLSCCAFSPDGSLAIFSCHQPSLRVWAFSQPFARTAGPAPETDCGPLSSAAFLRSRFEEITWKSDNLSKQAEGAVRERDVAIGAAQSTQRLLEEQKKRVEDLSCLPQMEFLLKSEKETLAQLEEKNATAQRQRVDSQQRADKVLEEALRAIHTKHLVAEELAEAERVEQQLADKLATKDFGQLSSDDVVGVLRELRLQHHIPRFAADKVDGKRLAGMTDSEMRSLGVLKLSERKRLWHSVSTVETCGYVTISRATIERIALNSNEETKAAVLSVLCGPAEVAKWLKSLRLKKNSRENLIAACLNGEMLLHLDDFDLAEIGVGARDRRLILEQVGSVRELYFYAVSLFCDVTRAAVGKPVPLRFICPITLRLMEDPVAAADGYIYERSAIKGWLEGHGVSPISGAPIAATPMVTCKLLCGAIEAFRKKEQIPL
eukprot:m51a1_g3402 putative wd-40 repeat-containing protein (894) ;mRNA; r:547638-551845